MTLHWTRFEILYFFSKINFPSKRYKGSAWWQALGHQLLAQFQLYQWEQSGPETQTYSAVLIIQLQYCSQLWVKYLTRVAVCPPREGNLDNVAGDLWSVKNGCKSLGVWLGQEDAQQGMEVHSNICATFVKKGWGRLIQRTKQNLWTQVPGR